MTFRPLFGIDDSGKSESEAEKDTAQTIYQNETLLMLGAIFGELQLLNARFESAFETTIEASDV